MNSPEAKMNQPLVLACSGACNVGEMADRAARRLHAEGLARMVCLASLAARVESALECARQAPWLLMLDGCAMACGEEIVKELGLAPRLSLIVTNWGVRKVPHGCCSVTDVDLVVKAAKHAVFEQSGETQER